MEARSIESFLRQPLGRFARGASYLVWCANPFLCGVSYWGRPTVADASDVVRLAAIDEHPAMRAPFDVLTDARLVRSIDGAAFEILEHHLRRKRGDYARRIRRNAVLHPAGVIGSVVAGLYAVVAASHEWRTFVRLDDALLWLGRGDDQNLALALTRLSDGIAGDAVERLRRVLDANEAAPPIEEAAAKLGVSARSLQRALEAAGVTYREETRRTRLERAAALLRDPDLKGDEVARRAGYASSASLRGALRRLVGNPMRRV